MLTQIESITGIFVGIGLLAASFGYVYSQFFKGKNERTKEDIETENSLMTYLKNQISGFELIIKDLNIKIAENDKKCADELNVLRTELLTYKAVNDEKDNTIKKYLEILQNRNPELEKAMGDISSSLIEIKKFMSNIDKHMEVQKKDLKIEAVVSHNT